ncbi:cytidyltransferase-like protein [Saccharothrix tamanrassetensis]|uniref:Phosphopantetheine adenylyltransferase n=1 Tax=Saccharothrix tamanrassetensis TaxID=1051531 RepID=A0A841CUA7_9PSEU|nr:adenylyltransferase/cytidyltransferase family protein [Saccharothrix tamanrassetensis]MBB5959728.1 cytidyltransferase-like protein [Saccharothrix tamanrassetensis]
MAWQAVRAVFPGSFDPATQGHLDVARRAAGMFDEVVMCVLTNPAKTGRFPLAERLALLADMTSDLANVTVDSSPGRLLVDYCRQTGVDVILRDVHPGRPGARVADGSDEPPPERHRNAPRADRSRAGLHLLDPHRGDSPAVTPPDRPSRAFTTRRGRQPPMITSPR